jgi:hypothetical protein
LFGLFVYTHYQSLCLLAYRPYPAPETAVPLLKFDAARLPELVVAPPDSVNALWPFAWPMADPALEPTDPPVAAETAFPKLTFEAARLPDKLVVVPDIQPAACLFSWPMIDAALFCAKTAFDVVARTSSPAAMVAASIGRKFCSHILLLEHL